MDKARIRIDFNEMVDDSLCLLSKEDVIQDSSGKVIQLHDGLLIDVYMDDLDEQGNPDPLLASGTVEVNASSGWSSQVKWCIRIDERGIQPLSEIQSGAAK